VVRLPGCSRSVDGTEYQIVSKTRYNYASGVDRVVLRLANVEKKLCSFIRSCIGDVIYDRYEKQKSNDGI
jgi:hypothetical protein